MTREATRIHIAGSAVAMLAALVLGAAGSAEPWPYIPFDELHGLGNHYGEYQNYGSGAYYHDGDDLVTPSGPEETYSVSDGTVTHITYYDPYYSGIMIGEPVAEGEGWLYWHINSATFQFDVGDAVQTHDYIGTTAYWPVAQFHHTHFNKVRGTGGYPWTWYLSIDNPLAHMEPNDDPDPPVFETTYQGDIFAFARQGTGTLLNPASLTGDVDIISRIVDIIGLPQWGLNPWRIDYWIEGATQSVPLTNTVTFSGEIPPDNTVSVIYRTQSPLRTIGNYDSRIFYFMVTNTDGDGYVELSDADYSWRTGDFAPGDYWVYVRAGDVGGNVTTDSMLCTISGVVHPDIHLPESHHDFGPVPPLDTAIWNLRVMNLGSDWLSIRETESTNPAFETDRSHFFVPPDSGVVEVEASFTPSGTGMYLGALEISTNDSDEPIVFVALEGMGFDPSAVEDPADTGAFGIRTVRMVPGGNLEVTYVLDPARPATLEIIDAMGRRVDRIEITHGGTGAHRWTWGGSDRAGRRMPSGVYFVRLRSNDRESVGSGILLR